MAAWHRLTSRFRLSWRCFAGHSSNVPLYRPALRRLSVCYLRAPLYFVTACTSLRQPLLANTAIHRAFLGYAAESSQRDIWVGSYVLMPDHLHLFVRFGIAVREPKPLSNWMKSLKNHLSKTLRISGVPAPHWQKGFFDRVLRSEESYEEKCSYVAANPLRAGLVGEGEKWPFAGEIHRLSAPRD